MLNRRAFLAKLLEMGAAAFILAAGDLGCAQPGPRALVYRGPAGCDGCSEALAQLLQRAPFNFDVRFVGPSEDLDISAATLKTATLYAQPGGGDSVDHAYHLMRDHASEIRDFVSAGGRYLGTCMGGYLAGATPGFKLFPGDTNEFIASAGASVQTTADTVVQVNWRGQLRWMYFQDGPYFILKKNARGAQVLATYTNGEIAALVVPYGKGMVGVCGPHPEADASWYKDAGITGYRPTPDLGYDLIDTTMRRG